MGKSVFDAKLPVYRLFSKKGRMKNSQTYKQKMITKRILFSFLKISRREWRITQCYKSILEEKKMCKRE